MKYFIKKDYTWNEEAQQPGQKIYTILKVDDTVKDQEVYDIIDCNYEKIDDVKILTLTSGTFLSATK